MEAPELLAPARAPGRSALVLDVDGTLAPIAPRPELAAVPAETRAELERLVGRYLLVACVSGRAGEDARRLVGVDGIELVETTASSSIPARTSSPRDRPLPRRGRAPVEDKTLSLTYHYREAEDENAARAELEEVAERAPATGLDARWGRRCWRSGRRRGLQGDGRAGSGRTLRRPARAVRRRRHDRPGRLRRPRARSASSAPCASRSHPPRARPSCARPPTSSSRGRRSSPGSYPPVEDVQRGRRPR